VKIYVAAVGALRKEERGDETQFTTKIGGTKKLVWIPVFRFCKISFPVFVKFHSLGFWIFVKRDQILTLF